MMANRCGYPKTVEKGLEDQVAGGDRPAAVGVGFGSRRFSAIAQYPEGCLAISKPCWFGNRAVLLTSLFNAGNACSPPGISISIPLGDWDFVRYSPRQIECSPQQIELLPQQTELSSHFIPRTHPIQTTSRYL